MIGFLMSTIDFVLVWVVRSLFRFYFFFFQAEDGIRDLTVTGVQTCALPICGGGRGVEHRYALGGAIDPIEYQAMQMDVEIGSRANRLSEGHREGRGLDAFERSEEHTSELQSQSNLGCRLLLEKKNTVKVSQS